MEQSSVGRSAPLWALWEVPSLAASPKTITSAFTHMSWKSAGLHIVMTGRLSSVPNCLRRVVTYYEVPPEYGRTEKRGTVVNDRTVLVDPRTHRIVQIIE